MSSRLSLSTIFSWLAPTAPALKLFHYLLPSPVKASGASCWFSEKPYSPTKTPIRSNRVEFGSQFVGTQSDQEGLSPTQSYLALISKPFLGSLEAPGFL